MRVLVIVCLLPLALAGWGGDSSEEDYMVDKKEVSIKPKWEKLAQFGKYLEFKDKLMKMKEMEQKKAVFEEFKAWKMQKAKKDQSDWEKSEWESKDHAEKFEAILGKMTSNKKKYGMMVMDAFLGMCKCKNEMGMDMTYMFKDKKGDDMGDMFEVEMPDFMGNNTAKGQFLMSLSKEQQMDVVKFGLVKSMCQGAKTYITYAKEFKATYMKEDW